MTRSGGFGMRPAAVSFTLPWSTRHMAVTRLIGTDGRLDLTIDGLTFYRSKSAALARGTQRIHQVDWPQILGAKVVRSQKGRPIVRITVRDAPPVSRQRKDPYAMPIKRKLADDAHEFVDLVNAEVNVRLRWLAASQPDDGEQATLG